MTAVADALSKMRGAGFSVQVVSGRLRVSPADRLTPVQRQWVAANRDTLIAELVKDDPHIGAMVEVFDATIVRVTPADDVWETKTPPVSVSYSVYERPDPTDTVCCGDCQYGRRALPGDELAAWRLCEAGQGGWFALARHRCNEFKVAL